MTAHGTVPLTAPDGGWTTDDLDAMPEDGVRRELHDGVLVVSQRVWNAAELAGMPRDGVRRDLIDGVLWVFPRASAGHRRAVGRVAAVLAGHPDGAARGDRPGCGSTRIP